MPILNLKNSPITTRTIDLIKVRNTSFFETEIFYACEFSHLLFSTADLKRLDDLSPKNCNFRHRSNLKASNNQKNLSNFYKPNANGKLKMSIKNCDVVLFC